MHPLYGWEVSGRDARHAVPPQVGVGLASEQKCGRRTGYAAPATSSPSVTAEQDPRPEVLAQWAPSFSAQARREPSGVKVGLAEVNEAALLAKSGWKCRCS